MDDHMRLGILGGGRRATQLNLTLYSQEIGTSTEGAAEKKIEAESHDTFRHSMSRGIFSHKFDTNRTYKLCFKSGKEIGSTTVHLKFDYEEEQQLSNPGKIGESLLVVQKLFSAIQEIETDIMEQFEENSLYEKVYDEIEGRVTTCFTIKSVALVVVALVHGTIFFSLIEKHMGKIGGIVMPI